MSEKNAFLIFDREKLEVLRYNKEQLYLYVNLMLDAEFENKIHSSGIEIKRGELISGRSYYSKKINITEDKYRYHLKNLIKTRHVSQKSTNKFSVITLCHYYHKANLKKENSPSVTLQFPENTPSNQIENKNISMYKGGGNFGFFKNIYITDQQKDSLKLLYFQCPETRDEADRYTEETLEYFDNKLEVIDKNSWKPVNAQYAELRILISAKVRKIREDANKFSKGHSRPQNGYYSSSKVVNICETRNKGIEVTKREVLEKIKADKKNRSSPLDFSKEEAINWYNNLPEMAKNGFFGREIRKKWQLADVSSNKTSLTQE